MLFRYALINAVFLLPLPPPPLECPDTCSAIGLSLGNIHLTSIAAPCTPRLALSNRGEMGNGDGDRALLTSTPSGTHSIDRLQI